MIKSYPKIVPLVGKYGDLALGKEVEITEKVDGSMFAFGLDEEGKLHCRSKGQPISIEAPPGLFRPAVEYVVSIQNKLPLNTVFYGETLKTERHNTLKYGRIPLNHIALFGVFDFERTKGSEWEIVEEWAHILDVDVVPLLYRGTINSMDQFAEFLKAKSFLGEADIEGIVVKDYARPMEFAGMIYPLTVLKYVSEAFKEKHAGNPDWVAPRDKLDELFRQYKTEARWNKAVQRLKESGNWTGEPKDIGPLMKDLWADTVVEEKANIQEQLWNLFKKRFAHAIQAGLPEWYKKQLLEAPKEE